MNRIWRQEKRLAHCRGSDQTGKSVRTCAINGAAGRPLHRAVPHAPERLQVAREARRRRTADSSSLLGADLAQRGAARGVGRPARAPSRGSRRRRRRPVRRAHRVQQAGGHALREGRPLQRDHRHADPQRLAGGGVGVARPGIEIDVGTGQAAQVLGQRQQRREQQALGVDAARAPPRPSACLHVGVPLQQPQHRVGLRAQQRAPEVEDFFRDLVRLVERAQQQLVVGGAPVGAGRARGSARRASLGW